MKSLARPMKSPAEPMKGPAEPMKGLAEAMKSPAIKIGARALLLHHAATPSTRRRGRAAIKAPTTWPCAMGKEKRLAKKKNAAEGERVPIDRGRLMGDPNISSYGYGPARGPATQC